MCLKELPARWRANVRLGPEIPQTVGPDKLASYELGVKSELFDKCSLISRAPGLT